MIKHPTFDKKHFTQDHLQIPAIDALVASHLDFHLTGSRFFRTSHANSDWDFFTEDTNEAHQVLIALGFERLNRDMEEALQLRYAGDPNIACVYQKISPYKDGDGTSYALVQVQLVRDMGLKELAQKLLSELPVYPQFLFDKRSDTDRAWWRWAFKVASQIDEAYREGANRAALSLGASEGDG